MGPVVGSLLGVPHLSPRDSYPFSCSGSKLFVPRGVRQISTDTDTDTDSELLSLRASPGGCCLRIGAHSVSRVGGHSYSYSYLNRQFSGAWPHWVRNQYADNKCHFGIKRFGNKPYEGLQTSRVSSLDINTQMGQNVNISFFA
jgi:hypothetical protein